MTLRLNCKCGATRDVTSQSPSELRYEESLFRRDHSQEGCGLLTKKEAQKIQYAKNAMLAKIEARKLKKKKKAKKV